MKRLPIAHKVIDCACDTYVTKILNSFLGFVLQFKSAFCNLKTIKFKHIIQKFKKIFLKKMLSTFSLFLILLN